MWKRGYEPLATEDDDDGVNQSSRSPICFLSELCICWMNSIFKIGSERPLNQSDFLPLPDEERTRDITETTSRPLERERTGRRGPWEQGREVCEML